ncbi:MAG: hybrid sensor histidine kinase/response regulator [Caulobacter sp.]|nr:hybrid sensor histidine kinase/response regulator [Caulobacter sp.]
MANAIKAATWTDIAAHRRADVKIILPMSVLAAVGSASWLGALLPLAWFAGVVALTTVNFLLCSWVESRRMPRPWLEWLVAGYTFLHTLAYSTLPLALFLHGRPTSIVAGACMLGAVAISSTGEVVISRRIGLASLAALSVVSVIAVTGMGAATPMQGLFAAISAFCFQAYIALHAFQQTAAQRLLTASLETARTKEAEAASANEAKTVFLATMSHEIRTPLNGVLGMAGVMEMGDLSAVQRERLSVIRQSGEALTTILNDVLDLSKIEAGKLQLEMLEFDLADLLRQACAPFAMLAREKGLTLTLDIAPEAVGSYLGDPTRVRQVLFNLVSNAVKFTQVGGIAIHACRHEHVGEANWGDKRRHDDGQLIIAVADTGEGIPPGKAEHLFAKFTQADASTTRQHGGTGLGLAICRELCGLMGGEITASSRLGQGATFTIALPLPKVMTLSGFGGRGTAAAQADLAIWDLTAQEPPASLPPRHGEGGEPPEPASGRPEDRLHEAGGWAPLEATPAPEPMVSTDPDPLPVRILAAEDNPTNQRVLKAILAQAGIDPTIVENGALAVEAWSVGHWDLILMDIHMPVMDGVEALKEIRRREALSGRARTPIIALTANAMSHQVQGLMADGMDGHVSKPIEVAVLFGAIERALSAGEQRGAPEADRAVGFG